MKKLIYSSYTKFIAVVAIILCGVLAVNVVVDTASWFMSEDEQIYGFEDSFDKSDYFTLMLYEPGEIVREAYNAFDRHQNESEYYDNTFYENYGDVDKKISISDAALYEYIDANLSRMRNADKVDYFISINDRIFTNCGAKRAEDIVRDRFYFYAGRDESGNVYSGTSSRTAWPRGYIEIISRYNTTDVISVSASITEDYAAECERIWKTQEARIRDAFYNALALVILALLLLIYLIAVCGKTKDGEHKPMWLDSIWTEIHLGIIGFGGFGTLFLGATAIDELFTSHFPLYMGKATVLAISAVGGLIVLTSLLSIIRKIKCKTFISGSFICIIFRWLLRSWAKLRHFIRGCAKPLTGKTGLILIAMLFIYTAVIGLCGIFTLEAPLFFFFAIALFVFACFVLAYRAKDIDEIKRGAEEVRNGNRTYKIPETRSEDLRELAQNINETATGLDKSVSAKLRAERLKTELITNVSHDLKTPLTSIISYTELLQSVENLPEEARDYIQIIAKKGDRLKNLTQDLFDISKVQSGNEVINFEKLNISLLINQSLGEHDSEIKESGLNFCVNVDKELYILADGRKMSRVIGNLISNILKYTMQNTRVFISAFEKDNEVIVEFKNIASYPMEFDAEEIMGRFVRGDESRTIDGNGLGLAIARSYIQAQNGTFDIVIDGDLFKAIIKFQENSV